jgi:hypothetical protein
MDTVHHGHGVSACFGSGLAPDRGCFFPSKVRFELTQNLVYDTSHFIESSHNRLSSHYLLFAKRDLKTEGYSLAWFRIWRANKKFNAWRERERGCRPA